MTTHDRERGTMLRRLDPYYLQQQALGHLKVMVPEAKWTEANPVYRLVAGTAPDGELYVVCTEGVGWKVEYTKPLAMDVYVKWEENGEAHGGMSQTTVFLSQHEIKQAMEHSDEDVDLADFVREFGDRLEANFSIWHSKFNPKPKRTRKTVKK